MILVNPIQWTRGIPKAEFWLYSTPLCDICVDEGRLHINDTFIGDFDSADGAKEVAEEMICIFIRDHFASANDVCVSPEGKQTLAAIKRAWWGDAS